MAESQRIEAQARAELELKVNMLKELTASNVKLRADALESRVNQAIAQRAATEWRRAEAEIRSDLQRMEVKAADARTSCA